MITSIVVGVLVGLVSGMVAVHLYDIRQTQKQVVWMREQNQMIDWMRIGMNRPSFPMCSPSRQPMTDVYEEWRKRSEDLWGERIQDAMAQLSVNALAQIDEMADKNSSPIPAPEWILPKKEQE